MAKFRKYALIALAIVAFLTLMFLLYKGTQRNEATPGRTATPSVSTSSAPALSAPVQTPQVSEQSAQAAPAPEQPQQSQGAQDSPSEFASPSATNTAKPSPSTSSDAGQEQHKADATSAAPSASGSASASPGKEPTCPEDVSYQQVADGEADCTFDYSKVRLKTMQEAEQYARKWLYPEPGTYIQVRDYREAKVRIPGMDKPQSVFVVRAVARSSGDQGGSGAVTWSVIWPNGYYLTSDDLPDGIEAR